MARRWILAVLRHRQFFSIAEFNAAIWALLPGLNARPMRRLGISRRELFHQLARPPLRPLPKQFIFRLGATMACSGHDARTP